MFAYATSKWLMIGLLLFTNVKLLAQGPPEIRTLLVRGYSGEVAIVRVNGRAFVDLQALVQVTGSSLALERGQAVLTLPSADTPAPSAAGQPVSAGFSRPFVGAAIEALASMREWGSTLAVTIRNGFPLGNAINPYPARAAEKVYLAAAAASTDDDRSGLDLLRSELAKVQAWSDKLVKARTSMSAANFAMSENVMQEDPMFQGALQCGQYLAQMLGGGSFQGPGACR